MDQEKTVSIGDVQYKVAQFSPGIQQAVEIYNGIQIDLQKSQIEVVKNQAALQSIGNQITEGIKHELAQLEAAKEAAKEAAPENTKATKPAAKKAKAK